MPLTSTRTIIMDSSARSLLSLFAAFLICCAVLKPVQASDPDPLVDFSPDAEDNFVFRDVFKNGANTVAAGGTRAALNISIFPVLKGQGITFVQFKLKPCGENPPHTHPRATEILTLVSGGPIQAGLVDTQGKAHIYILYPGDIIMFPRAMLHFELNVGTEEAMFVSGLNSQNPGVLNAAGSLLKLPDRAAASAFNQDLETVQKLKKEIYPYSDELQLDIRAGCVPGQYVTPLF